VAFNRDEQGRRPRVTGAELLVTQLRRHGVDVVFGLPGVQLYALMAALREEPEIRFVTTRHEQATSYMADGYARAGGRLGVAVVVPGPGLLNAAAGLSTAYSASSPVLVVTGQIPRALLGREVGVLHEIVDQLDAIAPVTKWRQRILDADAVPAAIAQAVLEATSGRPRPVVVDLPPETLAEDADVEPFAVPELERLVPDAARLDEAAGLLADAAETIVYAGGGVHASGANDVLLELAELLQAPVITSPEGKGAISDRNPLSLGAALWSAGPVRERLEAAEVVLAVGTRFASGTSFAPGTSSVAVTKRADQLVVQIDIDEAELGRNHENTFSLHGDARATIERLLERLRAGTTPRPSRRAELEAVRAEVASVATHEPQSSILRSLRRNLPDDAIVVVDMNRVGYYAHSFWPVYEPRTYLTSSYSGNLGFAYPAALGAKVANPDAPVVALVGDGGFLYNAQELATAVQFGINVVAVVFNDNAYGNVMQDLDESWGGSYGSQLQNPDLVKLGESYGALALRAAAPEDVGELVRRAIDSRRPALIDVPIGEVERPKFYAELRASTKYAG
jgi:acetolactate synthase-1/2/3 large subunit